MQYARWHNEAQHRLHDSEAPLHVALAVNGAENEKYLYDNDEEEKEEGAILDCNSQ